MNHWVIAIIVLTLLSVAGCASDIPKVVDVPVYTKPNIIIPRRPTLISDGKGDYNQVLKSVELDENSLMLYSLQLENILRGLK